MFDHDALYRVLDTHFVGHLVREGEARVSEDGQELPDMPDVMLEDLIDELDAALEELHEEFDGVANAPVAVAYGFIDGVVAQADGSYTSYEDAYVADMRNADYADLDRAIQQFTQEFDGNRDWDEAALGYLREVTKGGDSDRNLEDAFWLAQAKGFVYGADLSEDYEWKVMVDASGNIIVTDEEAIDDFTMRKLSEEGNGNGLFGKLTDMLGIDLGKLEAALGEVVEEEEDAENAENA